MANTNRYQTYANYRPVYYHQGAKPRETGPRQDQKPQHAKGFGYYLRRVLFLLFVVLLIIAGIARLEYDHRNIDIPELRSGIKGYCLDDRNNKLTPNNEVDAWKCNGSTAQNWVLTATQIKHLGKYCLDIASNGKVQGDKIVLNKCSKTSGEIWVRYLDGYQNPTSNMCLDVPNSKTGKQLVLYSCNQMTQFNESWTPATWTGLIVGISDTPCTGSEGEKVACYAQRQYAAWEYDPGIHPALINDYTLGNTSEEWCADFVSYVYREAGYPFTNGERGSNGWDEYVADNVQNMGFTMHPANGYVPQPGDVAFFDYPGGHVEIVVSGGKHPTFIYGDAGTIDPATQNGDMEENSITNDGEAGQVVYYLSPN